MPHALKRLALRGLTGLAAFGAATPVLAAPTTPSYLDLYYVGIAELEADDVEFDDGDGFGAKGRFMVTPDIFLSAEYQNSEYDPFNAQTTDVFGQVFNRRFEIEVETFRVGGGVHFAESPFFVMGEYIGFEAELSTTGSEGDEEVVGEDSDESGFGVHGGIDGQFNEMLGLHAQIGYIDVGDVGSGVEALIGASLSFNPGLGVFVDYRYSDLEEGNSQTELTDVRVGLRVSFR